jgi:hypothetical protein
MKRRAKEKDDKNFDKVLKQIQRKDNALAGTSNDLWMASLNTTGMPLQNAM